MLGDGQQQCVYRAEGAGLGHREDAGKHAAHDDDRRYEPGQCGRDGGGPGAMAYAASKGAVMTMTRAMAKEFGPRMRVNALCPGMIDTDFHNIFTKPEVREHVANVSPVKREGTSDEVAELAVFLASAQSAFMTGACVDTNGGMYFS